MTFFISPGNTIFMSALLGFLLAVPIALFTAYWIGAVGIKSISGIVGAFVGSILGLLAILYLTSMIVGVNGATAFFSAFLFCWMAGLVGAICIDQIVMGKTRRIIRD
jgi:hypothetical protein